jgi:hypothetical protein
MRQRGIPGLSLFKQVGTGPIRAIWSNEFACYVVSGGQLFQIFNDGNTTGTTNVLAGPVANSVAPAIIRSNGFQLAISSGGQAFIAAGGTSGVVPIIDTQGQPVTAVAMAFMDQYFITSIPNSNIFRISNLGPNGQIWDPGDEAEKEAYSDDIVCTWVDQPGGEYLWLFGSETSEVWTDTAGLFPFGRLPSCVFPIGCDSSWSVAGAAGFRSWLWRGTVYGCYGLNPPQRISDDGVEEALKTYSLLDQESAEAFSWIDGTHVFYALSFPFSGACWVYDWSTSLWHERAYFYNGQYSRYRPRVHAYAFGMHLVGDYATGTVYQMAETNYWDAPPIATPAGAPVPLLRRRVAPYISDSMKNDRYNRLTLDMDTGIGLEVASGQPGFNPKVLMRYSNDRGKTWSSNRVAVLGEIGDDSRRVFWTQLGASRIGFTADVSITDPVPFSVNAAFLDIGPGTSPGNRPTA